MMDAEEVARTLRARTSGRRSVRLPCGRIDASVPKELWHNIIPLERVLESFPPGSCVSNVNILGTPPGAGIQDYHMDNGDLAGDYHTVLIPLNHEVGMGVTEFVPGEGEAHYAPNDVGTATIFPGDCVHRGTANTSTHWRYCIYAIVLSGELATLGAAATFEEWR